jgi:hypothetical protein
MVVLVIYLHKAYIYLAYIYYDDNIMYDVVLVMWQSVVMWLMMWRV